MSTVKEEKSEADLESQARAEDQQKTENSKNKPFLKTIKKCWRSLKRFFYTQEYDKEREE